MKSREELDQIFEQVAKGFTFKDAHLELASDKRLDALIVFVEKYFIPDEPLSKSLGLTLNEEADGILRHLLQDNLSILLVSDITDDVIAVRVSCIANKEDGDFVDQISDEKMKLVQRFVGQKNDELNAFSKYGVDKAVHFLMLGVNPEFRRQGIASKIMNAAMDFYAQIGLDPVVYKGEGTSNFSQAIYEKSGFETLHELVHEDYKINGEVVFKDTGIHKSTKIYAKKL